MKLIQEIRPLFALKVIKVIKVYIKVVFEKNSNLHAKIHPPRLLIFQKKFQPPQLFQPPRLLILKLLHPLQTSTFIREMRVGNQRKVKLKSN